MTVTTATTSPNPPNSPTPAGPPPTPRLRWRVVVRTGGIGKMDPSRPSRPLSWHLVTCAGLEDPAAHCAEGARLIIAGDDPDGHCLVDGVCPRCAAALPA